MTQKVKNIILFGGIGLALIFVYVTFVKKAPTEEAPLVTTGANGAVMPVTPQGSTEPASTITSEFLSLLLNIKSIKLDDSVFQESAFMSLHDSSIILIQDTPEGRPNPFAPIGTDPVQTTTPGGTSSSSTTNGTSSGTSGSSSSGR